MCELSSSNKDGANQSIYKECRDVLLRRGIRKNQAMKIELMRNGGCMNSVDIAKNNVLVST